MCRALDRGPAYRRKPIEAEAQIGTAGPRPRTARLQQALRDARLLGRTLSRAPLPPGNRGCRPRSETCSAPDARRGQSDPPLGGTRSHTVERRFAPRPVPERSRGQVFEARWCSRKEWQDPGQPTPGCQVAFPKAFLEERKNDWVYLRDFTGRLPKIPHLRRQWNSRHCKWTAAHPSS